ncbi:MAG: amidase [Microbacteriaceae bacterium]|nr:amidase [Microbacteriaceae bacterium]
MVSDTLDDTASPGALAQREALRRGEVSARELTEAAIASADRHRHLGTFVSLEAELALNEADEADRLIAATPLDERHILPLLLGLPTAHKDLVRVRGFTTTHGSAAVPHLRATHDDPIPAIVRDAGAICIGKTQVPEFGIAGYSENLIAAPARNPHDPERSAGGSSGGTAAAIASGTITAAIASDAGGSIRIPSAACGLIGLKPGRDTVPADQLLLGASTADADPLAPPRLGVSGPIARTASDAALFYDAITASSAAGSPPLEPALAALQRAHELRGLRIGVSFASPFESAMPIEFDEAARSAVARAARRLTGAGHHVDEATIAYDPAYPEFFTTVWTRALLTIPLEPAAEAQLGTLARWFLEQARATPADTVAAALAQLHRFIDDTTAQWGAYDLVLTPALAFTAPSIGDFWQGSPADDYRLQCEWAPQTSLVNVVGVPAITVPMSVDPDGLPRGVQLIGRAGSEVTLLQVAEVLSSSR